MKPIRQLVSTFTSLQPRQLSATPAARTLRDLARQAGQKVRQHLPKRRPGRPSPQPTGYVQYNESNALNALNALNELNELKARHQRNVKANNEMGAHLGLDRLEAMRADLVSNQQQVVETAAVARKGHCPQPDEWQSAFSMQYAYKGSEAAPEIPPAVSEQVPAPAPEPVTIRPQAVPVDQTEAQFQPLTDAHKAIMEGVRAARLGTMQDTRAGNMVQHLGDAQNAIAAIPQRQAGDAEADSAHLEAFKGYQAHLDAAHRDGLVLRASIMSSNGDKTAVDLLVRELEEQQKAVAAYIRQLEV